MSKAMSLKSKIRNIARDKHVPMQVILQNYMSERLLVRLSKTKYKDNFVLKGSMLVAAIVGLDSRAIVDLDATLINLPFTPETIEKVLKEICATPAEDEVDFSLISIVPIRDDDLYNGYHIALSAKYDTVIYPLSINVSTGDAITPSPVLFPFNKIFEDNKTFNLWVYNTETILAEKVETILRRSVFNTRPRDFHDVYILVTTQNYNRALFAEALKATAMHRGTEAQILDAKAILKNILESKELWAMWDKYRKQVAYAKDIEFDSVVNAISEIVVQ